VITGATRVAGVIGDPVRHSLSPVLHNAAYHALGLDWVYAAFHVPEGAAAEALAGMRALGLVGLSVTMPHKTAVADACDECSPDAAVLRSVNTVTVRPDGSLFGESTDGDGFLRACAEAGHDPAGAAVLVLGAGGAARAVALALGRAGAGVAMSARRLEAAEDAAAAVGATVRTWDERVMAAAEATIVVNATPLGMHGDGVPLPAEAVDAGQVVIDLVYHPLETELLHLARERGAATVDGLGMLVHQAALQVERWSGRTAPVAAMRAAVVDHLSRS
jgi:shikimate dehydrogenase